MEPAPARRLDGGHGQETADPAPPPRLPAQRPGAGPGGRRPAPCARPAPFVRLVAPGARGAPLPAQLAAASVTLAGVPRPEYYGNPAGLTQDIDVVRAIYGAFAVRDLEGALDFIDPECEIHVDGTARAAGRQGPYVGHDGLRRYFADVEAVWQKLEIRADDFRVIPGSVVVMGHVEGLGYEGPFRRAAMWTWRLENGRARFLRVTDLGAVHPAA